MKTRLLLIAAILASAIQLLAQNDSTVYRFGLPVTEDDTTRQFPAVDMEPQNKLVAVRANELPKKVLRALNREEQYHGWRDTTVYFEKNTGLYHVPVKHEDGVRVFGLNADGHPVTFDVVTERRD